MFSLLGRTKPILASKNWGRQIVIENPSVSVLAEPPVAVVDKVVDKKEPATLPRPTCNISTLQFAKKSLPRNFYGRSIPRSTRSTANDSQISRCLRSISSLADGSLRNPSFFADGGIFDQIYQPK